MTRGVTLEQLIYNLRSEVGQSTNPAVSRSTRGRFITVLNRIQRRLYADFQWPFLNIERDIMVQAGSRYYDFPADIDMDRTVRVEVKFGGMWQKVGYKITNVQMNEFDSDANVRNSPVWRWDYYLEAASQVPQMEMWPLPAENADVDTLENAVRVFGTQKLSDMVNDADTCLLDGDLLVMYAAAEILAKVRTADATAKLENANKLYTSLKGRASPSEPFKIGGDTFDDDCERRPRRELFAVYNKPPE